MRRLHQVSILSLFMIALSAAMALAQTTIMTRTSPKGVGYLTDDKGMTLYYYTKDADGQSACYGGCATAWPIYYAPTVTVPSSLKTTDFGTVTRTDGTKQTTYLGWPLYYWQRDKAAGDMTGEGVGGVWYILPIPAYTVMVSTNATLGNYLVDGMGNTLYWFTKDSVSTSACSGDCVKNWPLFYASSIVAPSAVLASDFATIKRADGASQTTYKGYPLYYWIKDAKRGDATGQDVGKVWYVIDPAKFQVK